MGSGFLDFATGQVVTEAEVQGYLMNQAVMFFADATARDAAITAPEEGMHAYLADANVVTYYTGAAWRVGPGAVTASGDTIYFDGTSWVRLPKGTDGEFLTLTAGVPDWAPVPPGPQTVVKQADEDVASSTTLQDDNELFVAVPANATKTFLAFIAVDGSSGGAGTVAKITFVGPAGSTVLFQAIYSANVGVASGPNAILAGNNTAGGATITADTGNTSGEGFVVRGTIENGGTAGDLKLQWAQNSSSVTPSRVLAGSSMVVI